MPLGQGYTVEAQMKGKNSVHIIYYVYIVSIGCQDSKQPYLFFVNIIDSDGVGGIQLSCYERYNENVHISLKPEVVKNREEYNKKFLDHSPTECGMKIDDVAFY